MSKHVPGGEVIMHPGPKNIKQGIKAEHGSHDVKRGFGGNDIIIQKAPKKSDENPLGQHNTEVKSQPGNTVVISNSQDTVIQEGEILEPPTLPPVQEEAEEEAEEGAEEETEEETEEEEEN